MRFTRTAGWVSVALVLATTSSAARAAELAVLRNGFTIRHERHEQRNEVTRLYLTAEADEYVDVPQGEIVRFEEAESVPVPIPAPTSEEAPAITLDKLIRAASIRNNVDWDLVMSLIHVESGFNPTAVSPKGAQGLMQLMPKTAAELGVTNPFDPGANVEGGTRYLRELLTRYNDNPVKALAAYNAGASSVEQYHGMPPYQETRSYVDRIIREWNHRKELAQHDRGPNALSHEKRAQTVTLGGSSSSLALAGTAGTSVRN